MARYDLDVGDWLRRKSRPGVSKSLMWEQFKAEAGLGVSRTHFSRVFRRCAKMRTLSTGGADLRIRDLAAIPAGTGYYGVFQWNTIAVDEKEFNLKKYAPNSCWVARDAGVRAVYKPLHKMLKQSPIYMVSAIAVSGLVLFALSDTPFDTGSFNEFLEQVIERLPRDGVRRWLRLDNAKFHRILPETARMLGQRGVGISNTAPSSCFMNPIEEHFSQVASKFHDSYARAVVQRDRYVVPREEVKEMIVDAAQCVGRRDNRAIFARAGLI
jgi:hypothetical protein